MDVRDRLADEAVLRVGEVSAVSGRSVSVTVDKEKNLSELFYDGDVLKNISVGSYIDIRKGYLSLIGKVDGENSSPERSEVQGTESVVISQRIISISLVGYLDRRGIFHGGTKELPLVGNEAYLLTREKVHQIHNLIDNDNVGMEFAVSDYEGYKISLPVDGLMNSHIAIFGNTGSGKSNTLAMLYQTFISLMRSRNANAFNSNCKILFFDFNGEYIQPNCLSSEKHIFNLSTYHDNGDKIPLSEEGLLDIEVLSVLGDATEKTQRPFLSRCLRLYSRVMEGDDRESHIKNIIKNQVSRVLQMSDKIRADLLIDYLRQILPESLDEQGNPIELTHDLDWNNTLKEFIFNGQYLKSHPDQIPNTHIYSLVDRYEIKQDVILDFLTFAYIQLIYDVLSNRAQNEHIAPVINKLNSKQSSIRKIFDPQNIGDVFEQSNVVVISLNDVNIEMKKTIPLLISKRVYGRQKRLSESNTLNIVIDEAHNILSNESFREAESWKDYRLETFEEIIKEGRKFGCFVTISSQRPNDISHTITSQAHNYFIHRLINQKDLQSIASAVSYIDKITEESIPTLPTGTCIFSGIAGQMPLKIAVNPLEEHLKPKSNTRKYTQIVAPDDAPEIPSFL